MGGGIFKFGKGGILTMFKDYLFAIRILFGVLFSIYSIYLTKLLFCKDNKADAQWVIEKSILPMCINVFVVFISTFFSIVRFRVVLLVCIATDLVHVLIRVLLNFKMESPEDLSHLQHHCMIAVLEIIVLILSFLF